MQFIPNSPIPPNGIISILLKAFYFLRFANVEYSTAMFGGCSPRDDRKNLKPHFQPARLLPDSS
jgi:hypothetical protein